MAKSNYSWLRIVLAIAVIIFMLGSCIYLRRPIIPPLGEGSTTTLPGGGGTGDGGDDVATTTLPLQILCNGVWNPTPSNCANAYCSGDGVCTYKPATLVAPADCVCEYPECNVGTATCQDKCVSEGYAYSVCAGSDGCPDMWVQMSGGSYGCSDYPCAMCCCMII